MPLKHVRTLLFWVIVLVISFCCCCCNPTSLRASHWTSSDLCYNNILTREIGWYILVCEWIWCGFYYVARATSVTRMWPVIKCNKTNSSHRNFYRGVGHDESWYWRLHTKHKNVSKIYIWNPHTFVRAVTFLEVLITCNKISI